MSATALTCPVHNVAAVFSETSAHVYHGRDYGGLWECPQEGCDCRVGCHPDGKPKGTLAGEQLRIARRNAHAAFDHLWSDWKLAGYDSNTSKVKRVMRVRAYEWLSEHMGIAFDDTHIAMFDESQCEQVVELINQHKPTAATIREAAQKRRATA